MTEPIKGWVFYDAGCPLCRGWAGRSHNLLARHGCHLIPLQSDFAKARLGLTENSPLDEMKLLTSAGKIYGGSDALLRLARSIWWAWPLFALAQIPGISALFRSAYRCLARNRYCFGSRCKLAHNSTNHRRHITTAFFEMP